MVLNNKGEIKNICIYGVGGVGGYFGGKIALGLSRIRNTTKRVFFIARGAHLDEIKKNGLILNTSEERGIICRPHLATDSIDEIPVPDLCLICVKSYDLDGAIKALTRKIKDETIIIPLLNGVDIYERIRGILNKGIILPACVYVGTHIEKPGVVTQKGGDGIILCGYDPGFPDFNNQEIIRFFDEMKIRFEWHDNPHTPIWEKYVFIAPFGLVIAHSEKTLGEVIADKGLKELVQRVMREVVSIAKRLGIDLPEDIENKSVEKAGNFPPETKTSYQRDIETKGKLNEGDLFGGTIIRLGEKTGVPTPVTRSIYHEIRRGLDNQ